MIPDIYWKTSDSMTKTTKFKPGKSGNPGGRPKGSKDKRTALRELLQPHAEALVKKAVAMAKQGDVSALKMCLDRLIPAYKPHDATVVLNEFGGSLTEQGQLILTTMASGTISPENASNILHALAIQARIVEVNDLENRIKQLEDKL